ncbi:MAG: hypothetical protein AB7I33_08115 [Gemmatimonadales bacterium]
MALLVLAGLPVAASAQVTSMADSAGRPREDRQELEVLRSSVAGTDSVQALFRRLRLETDLQYLDSARIVLDRYVAASHDSASAMFFEARIACAAGDPAPVEQAYFRGAEQVRNPSARGLYREDIGWIAMPGELAQFDALEDSVIAGWLHAFWNRRDVTNARSPGTTLREHCRRYFYALEHYRLTRGLRNPWWTTETASPGEDTTAGAPIDDPAVAAHLLTGVRSRQRLFDDRGLVYLRHGPPDQIQVELAEHLDVRGIGAAVVWRYFRPGGDLFLQFADVPFDGTAAAAVLARGVVAPHALCALTSGPVCKLTLPREYRQLTAADIRRMRGQASAAVDTALATDDYRPRFRRRLSPIVQFYGTASRHDSSGSLLAVFAIPGKELPARATGGRYVYPVGLLLGAVSADGHTVGSLDTMRFFVSDRPLQDEQYLVGYLELELVPGRYTVTLALSDSARQVGAAVSIDSLRIPDLELPRLTMGDLILGQFPPTATWYNRGSPVPLNPLNAWAEKGMLEVYYELGGLVPGQVYRTAIEFWQGSRRRLALNFDERATARRQTVRHSVNLGGLRPGDYRLVISVRNARTDEKVARDQKVHVRSVDSER